MAGIATRTIGLNERKRRTQRLFRVMVVGSLSVFFLLPLYAMAEFTTRDSGGTRSLDAWRAIADTPGLFQAVGISLALAALTAVGLLALLLPTMIWIRLRLPRLQRVVEFLCLLPLTIPAIVLVVGLAPVFLWVTYLFGDSAWTLAFAYIVLPMPYAYRALDTGLLALDCKTLAEAARSLGAGWPTVIFRVLAPNLSGALLNAGMLAVALVIGEFTIASLLGFHTLQTEIFTLGRVNAEVSVAVAVCSLLFSFVLLLAMSLIGNGDRKHTLENQ